MENQFASTGEFEVLKEAKYLTSDALLLRGDILLRTSGHTAMALENGAEATPRDTRDNEPSKWKGAKEAVDWAKENKILRGDDKGNLRLRDYITREEMCVMLHRAIKNGGPTM